MIPERFKLLEKFITPTNLHPMIESPVTERYRNNIIFSIGYDENQEIQIGPLQKSKLVKPSRTNILVSYLGIDVCESMTEYVRKSKLPVVTYPKVDGFWRHIQIRENSKQEFIITFRFSNFEKYKELWLEEKLELISYLTSRFPKLLHIYYQETVGLREPTIKDDIHSIYNNGIFSQKILSITFNIHPLAFFQVNYYTYEIILKILKKITLKNNNCLDLCSGIGIYSAILYKQFSTINAVDCNPYNFNYKHFNYIFNLDSVDNYIKKINFNNTSIIINPSRSGLTLDFINHINLNFKYIKQFIYISCNIKSLSNNLSLFNLQSHYIKDIIPINQFPHTPHTEFIINIIHSNLT